jgi:uncharacterized BrkB/YihY/UPF0761 family membrane protein
MKSRSPLHGSWPVSDCPYAIPSGLRAVACLDDQGLSEAWRFPRQRFALPSRRGLLFFVFAVVLTLVLCAVLPFLPPLLLSLRLIFG